MAQGLMGFVVGEERDWGDVPAALGMSVDPASGLLRGAWDGRVMLRGRHYSKRVHHPQRDKTHIHYYTELYAILDPPLRLSLRADALSMMERARSMLGGADLQVGHPELDRLFQIRARDTELARMVLWNVADSLVACAGQHPDVWVSDRYVTIQYEGYLRDVEKCRLALSQVGQIATRVLEVRAHARATWEAPLQQAWQAIADAWGLAHEPAAARMEGDVRGTRITVRLSDDGASTTLAMGLAAPLGCSITIGRQEGSGFFANLFRGQDIETGDPAFDAAYVVKGEPEPRVREVLHAGARHRLRELLSRTEGLNLENDGFEIVTAGRVDDPHALQAMLQVAFAAAEALTPLTPGQGPFRG